MKTREQKKERGSIELIVLGLLAALIVAIAVPALLRIGVTTGDALDYVNNQMDNAVQWGKGQN